MNFITTTVVQSDRVKQWWTNSGQDRTAYSQRSHYLLVELNRWPELEQDEWNSDIWEHNSCDKERQDVVETSHLRTRLKQRTNVPSNLAQHITKLINCSAFSTIWHVWSSRLQCRRVPMTCISYQADTTSSSSSRLLALSLNSLLSHRTSATVYMNTRENTPIILSLSSTSTVHFYLTWFTFLLHCRSSCLQQTVC